MFLASKAVWAGLVFLSLTTGIPGPHTTPVALRADLGKEVPSAGHHDDVKRLQRTLQGKGFYRGEGDGVFDLQTRASIRDFQKAENMRVTGHLDAQTADKLGVRPEGRWDISNEAAKGKPSAGIKWAKGPRRISKTLQKQVKTGVAPKSSPERPRGDTSR